MDRLGELRAIENNAPGGHHSAANGDSQHGLEASSVAITARIERIHNLSIALEALQAEYRANSDKSLKAQIDQTMSEINSLAAVTKEMLVDMNKETQSGKYSESVKAMRNNQFQLLSRRLIAASRGAWDMQNTHQTRMRGVVSRRIRARYHGSDGAPLTEERAEAMAQALIDEGREDRLFLQARDELERLMQQRDEILAIERTMRELHQMFTDLQFMVEQQGEGLLLVKHHIDRAVSHVEEGNRDLAKARKLQAKCCCIV